MVEDWGEMDIDDRVYLLVQSVYVRARKDKRMGLFHYACKRYYEMDDNGKRRAQRTIVVIFSMIASGAIIYAASQNWAAGLVLGVLFGIFLGYKLRV